VFANAHLDHVLGPPPPPRIAS
ncbi:hypothetical protein, partial [Frankia sp. AvcI1]